MALVEIPRRLGIVVCESHEQLHCNDNDIDDGPQRPGRYKNCQGLGNPSQVDSGLTDKLDHKSISPRQLLLLLLQA
jgi:hypothetical protein